MSLNTKELTQPMDTAPTDGRPILVDFGHTVIVMRYLDNSKTRHPWQGFVPVGMDWPRGKMKGWMPMPKGSEE
jgi:hypothetical protein